MTVQDLYDISSEIRMKRATGVSETYDMVNDISYLVSRVDGFTSLSRKVFKYELNNRFNNLDIISKSQLECHLECFSQAFETAYEVNKIRFLKEPKRYLDVYRQIL